MEPTPPPAAGEPGATAPGWYADPWGQSAYRWWDGTAWTAQVEAGASAPTASAPTSASAPIAALQQLSAEPSIVYLETQPGVAGGRIDLVRPDGALLGWAGGANPSSASGLFGHDVAIELFDARGVRLGAVLRPGGVGPKHHAVIDADGILIGKFLEPVILSNIVRVETGEGIIAQIHVGPTDSWLLGTGDRRLAHVHHTAEIHFFQNQRDTFWLEPLAPMPGWLFLIALLTPIEANVRLDAWNANRPRQ